MNRRTRALALLTLGAACATAAAPAGAADFTTHSELRVEADGQPLEPGANYSNHGVGVAAAEGACADQGRVRTSGANALGLVQHAGRQNGQLRPLYAQSFSSTPGLFACRIGAYAASGFDSYWLYNLNHQSATQAGDLQRVGRDDTVLWYFVECTESQGYSCVAGENYGRELGLRAPARAMPGEPFTVTAFTYSATGRPRPQAGIQVAGDGATTGVTDEDGHATITAADSTTLRATRESRGDIPSKPLEVCVAADLSSCPSRRGGDFYGTDRQDLILGGDGPDTIKPRGKPDRVRSGGGDDYVYARGGGRDRVACGAGHDVVKTTRGEDDIADDCEEKRLP